MQTLLRFNCLVERNDRCETFEQWRETFVFIKRKKQEGPGIHAFFFEKKEEENEGTGLANGRI